VVTRVATATALGVAVVWGRGVGRSSECVVIWDVVGVRGGEGAVDVGVGLPPHATGQSVPTMRSAKMVRNLCLFFTGAEDTTNWKIAPMVV